MTIGVEGTVDARIAERKIGDNLKWYDGVTHMRMFSLGKELRYKLENEKRVMTVDNPLFMTQITGGVFKQKEAS
jgi:hypothetical protein